MNKSRKLFTIALLASLAVHGAMLGGSGESEKKSPSAYVRSPLRIDMIQVEAAKDQKDAQVVAQKGTAQKDSKSAPSSRPSTKGKEDAKATYLRHVRKQIVSQKKFPFVAQKLGLSALYRLNIQIEPDGGFAYDFVSDQRHKAFDRAIKNLFKRIGRFKAPPASAGQGLIIEFDLEFKR